MDEMKLNLSTKIMRGLVASMVSKAIRKKLGYDIEIQLNELAATVVNGQAQLHISVDAKLDNNELKKILEAVVKD